MNSMQISGLAIYSLQFVSDNKISVAQEIGSDKLKMNWKEFMFDYYWPFVLKLTKYCTTLVSL